MDSWVRQRQVVITTYRALRVPIGDLSNRKNSLSGWGFLKMIRSVHKKCKGRYGNSFSRAGRCWKRKRRREGELDMLCDKSIVTIWYCGISRGRTCSILEKLHYSVWIVYPTYLLTCLLYIETLFPLPTPTPPYLPDPWLRRLCRVSFLSTLI